MDANYRVIISLFRIVWWFHVCVLFWGTAFILTLSHFVIATTVCTWYFANDRSELGSPIIKGFTWGLTLHIGTLAVGSLVLAIIWGIRTFLAYITAKVKAAEKESGVSNKLLDCALGCMNCLVACFERFIKWLNKHIYIQTILNSVGFFRGAANAIELLAANSLRFGTLNGLLELVVNFGSLLISITVTVFGYILLEFSEKWSSAVFETFAPLVVIFKIIRLSF